MANELLPCPFCGGDATVSECDDGSQYWRQAKCQVCFIETDFLYMTDEEIVDFWNRRMPTVPLPDEVRENLAEYAHDAWSGWMRYLFSKCDTRTGYFSNGEVICIPAWAVDRWQRQMNTPYADLPEEEKQSDREEADKMLAIVCRWQEGGGDGE